MDFEEYIKGQDQARKKQILKLSALFLDDKPTKESEEVGIRVLTTKDNRGKVDFIDPEDSESDEDEEEEKEEAVGETKENPTPFDVNMSPKLISRVPIPPFGAVEKVFRCPLCYMTLSEPVSTRCCVSRFCKSCLQKYLGNTTKDSQHPCPCCRAQIVAMRACRPDSNLAKLSTILRRNDDTSATDDFDSTSAIEAHKRRTQQFMKSAQAMHSDNITKVVNRARNVTRQVHSGKEVASSSMGARSPTRGVSSFDPFAARRESMRPPSRHSRREHELKSDEDMDEVEEDDEEEDEDEDEVEEIVERKELGKYDETVERLIHFSLQPILGVHTNSDKYEVSYYEGHVEVSSNLFTSAGATNDDDSYALEDLPNFDGVKVSKKEHLSTWRQIISRSVATHPLEKPFINASTNMTIGQLVSYVVGEKKKHDDVMAALIGLKNVPLAVWNDYAKSVGKLEDGKEQNGSGSVTVNGKHVRSDYRFNYDIWMMCNDVPVKMEPTFRLWEVCRAFWRADSPFIMYYRNIGTQKRAQHDDMNLDL